MSELRASTVSEADRALVDAYLDGVASPAELRALESRLLNCPELASELYALSRLEQAIVGTLGTRVSQSKSETSHRGVEKRGGRRAVFAIVVLLAIVVVGLLLGWVARVEDDPRSAVLTPANPAIPTRKQASPRSAAAPKFERISYHDFETIPSSYPRWDRAQVKDCPPGRRGSHCLAGIRMSLHQEQLGVTLGDWYRAFLPHASGIRIRFSAWVGQDTSVKSFPLEIAVHVGEGKNGETFWVKTMIDASVTWIDVDVSLDEARGFKSNHPLKTGDPISAIHITLPWKTNDVFFIDDFELVRVIDSP